MNGSIFRFPFKNGLVLFAIALISIGTIAAKSRDKSKAKTAAPSTTKSSSVSAPSQAKPESKPESSVPAAPFESTSSALESTPSLSPFSGTESLPTSAATTPAPTAALAEAVSPPLESKIIGYIKFQPSVSIQGTDYFVTENELNVGYQFDPKTQLSYTQLVNTQKRASSDLNLRTDDGWFNLKYAPWFSNDSGLSLSHQPRVFMPTHPGKRDSGMITQVRNYVALSQKLTDSVSVSLYEIPIAHLYSKAGNSIADSAKANPLFENRVYVGVDVSLMESKLNLGLLLKESSTMVSSFAGAGNRWSHFAWLSAEATYAVTPNLTLGLNYETGYVDASLMTPGLGGFQISDGLKDSIIRASVQVSL